jgi:hypothetical protein
MEERWELAFKNRPKIEGISAADEFLPASNDIDPPEETQHGN